MGKEEDITQISKFESGIDFKEEFTLTTAILNAKDKKHRRKLQKDSISKVLEFYFGMHYLTFMMIVGFYLFERLALNSDKYAITDKVILSFVGALVVQSAGIIVAAFSGLFKE
jgi:polyferredoxin